MCHGVLSMGYVLTSLIMICHFNMFLIVLQGGDQSRWID